MLLAGGVSAFSPSVSPPPQKHCDRQKANLRIRFKPSLPARGHPLLTGGGKIQKLKVGSAVLELVEHSRARAELGREAAGQPRAHPSTSVPPPLGQGLWEARCGWARNPPAEVSTSPKTYQHFTLEKAYLHGFLLGPSRPLQGTSSAPLFQPLRLERRGTSAHRPTLGEG